jgi:hypothetical protein
MNPPSPEQPSAHTGRPLVLISWNGRDTPLSHLLQDGEPHFDLLVFDYSGRAGTSAGPVPGLSPRLPARLLSEQTQCKGDIYQSLARWLRAQQAQGEPLPAQVSLIDDDVVLGVGDLNRLLHLGRCHGLHCYSAALSHDSVYTHRWMLQLPHRVWREALWVEVMMPVYDTRLFMAAAPHFEGNVSSWGLDKYLFPTVQQLTGLTRTGIVDAVMASHIRPITSGNTVYRNGLSAGEERERMRTLCLELLRTQRPDLLSGPWFERVFRQRHVRTRWEQLAYGLGRPLRRWLERST